MRLHVLQDIYMAQTTKCETNKKKKAIYKILNYDVVGNSCYVFSHVVVESYYSGDVDTM